MHLPTVAVLLSCLALAAPPPAAAWGQLGHRLVGHLAADELTPAAREEIAHLLQGEPEPTLAGIASWADDLRREDPGLGKRSARWHFVNLGESGCTYEPKRDCPRGNCVVRAIEAQAAILADRRKPVEARRRALKFVVHFVGDVHQPLHAGYARDKGGNTVQVNLAGRGTNLHALWDSGMLRDGAADESSWLLRLRALPLVVEAPPGRQPPPTAQWAAQSCALVRQEGFYPASPKLSPAYARRWLPVAGEQLRRAGARLADVLNAALKPPG